MHQCNSTASLSKHQLLTNSILLLFASTSLSEMPMHSNYQNFNLCSVQLYLLQATVWLFRYPHPRKCTIIIIISYSKFFCMQCYKFSNSLESEQDSIYLENSEAKKMDHPLLKFGFTFTVSHQLIEQHIQYIT